MNIKFADEETLNRFQQCREMSRDCENSLDRVITNLMCWHPHTDTAVIYRDFHEQSFFFQEIHADGKKGMCGGIIFHGRHDNGGDGGPSTFSVCLSPTDGYAIHT